MLIKRNDVFINPSLKLLKYITKKKNHIKKPPTKPHQKLNINPPPLREPDPPQSDEMYRKMYWTLMYFKLPLS